MPDNIFLLCYIKRCWYRSSITKYIENLSIAAKILLQTWKWPSHVEWASALLTGCRKHLSGSYQIAIEMNITNIKCERSWGAIRLISASLNVMGSLVSNVKCLQCRLRLSYIWRSPEGEHQTHFVFLPREFMIEGLVKTTVQYMTKQHFQLLHQKKLKVTN